MFFLVTHNRPDRCLKALKACLETKTTLPGIVVVNGGDQPTEYDECMKFLPEGWKMIKLPAPMLMGPAVQWCFNEFPGLEWYGQLTDDHVPMTEGWDRQLVEAAGKDAIASCNDLWQAPKRMHSATVWGGELLRKVGYWFPPGFNHMFIDDVWETLGRESGKWRCLMNVVVKHEHYGLDGKKDQVYADSEAHMEHDRLAFEDWIKTRARDDLTKIGGSKNDKIAGMNLFIATPAHGGKFDDIYVQAMVGTIPCLLNAGAGFRFRTIPNESSIEKARNLIVQEFLEAKDCTHLLFIDADMGWNGPDVLRLMSHGKDVVAAVGVRKSEGPPSFCLNAPRIRQCIETGTVEVNEVGTGMMLISRNCIEKMMKAYPELRWRDRHSGKVFPNLFQFTNQLTGPKTEEFPRGAPELWSEDFTFCQRWREIGGSVFVDQFIMLGHQGQKTFFGRFHDHLLDSSSEADFAQANKAMSAKPPQLKLVEKEQLALPLSEPDACAALDQAKEVAA
tara:strand:- start:539 stop:2050 length:1512 start_codon:yes stop_codon:yes gene_type:complete